MSEREPVYIGAVLIRLRRTMKLSQEELAYRSSLHEKTISQLEGNHQEPLLSTIYSLATALEMDVLDLMREINDHFKKHS